MNVSAVGPESIALASNQHPSKLAQAQSIAEKDSYRENAPGTKTPAGLARGVKIDIDA